MAKDSINEIKKHYQRGRVIFYDRVPDDVWIKIQSTILQIKEKSKRGKVGMSEAITKLIRNG